MNCYYCITDKRAKVLPPPLTAHFNNLHTSNTYTKIPLVNFKEPIKKFAQFLQLTFKFTALAENFN